MTVSTTKAEQVYTGNAAATTFATNFKLLEASHLTVRIRTIATGAEVTKTLDVDYSISGLEADAGATVTYPISGSPLPATEQIVLIRSVPFEQNTSIKNQTGFFPSVLENAYDLIVMMAQQVNDKAKRSLQFAVGSTFSQELPLLSGNRTLVTNAGGTAFIQGPTVTAIESAEANATAAAASAVDAAASAAAAALFDPDNFQPIDATLTSIAALGTAANKFAYTTDVDTWAEAAITAAGLALLDDADASAQRTTLGLSDALYLDERADHVNTPAAGKGEFWVRNDTPCVPVFTDDAGTDEVLASKAYVDAALLPTAGAVGGLVWARYAVAADVTFGSSVAGSDLNPTGAVWGINTFTSSSGVTNLPTGTALSGTWRCLGLSDNTEGSNPTLRSATLWQRIA